MHTRMPPQELHITALLFGSLVGHQLVSSITLGMALRYIQVGGAGGRGLGAVCALARVRARVLSQVSSCIVSCCMLAHESIWLSMATHPPSRPPLTWCPLYLQEALAKPHGSKMYNFGVAALRQFLSIAHTWPQFCTRVLQVRLGFGT